MYESFDAAYVDDSEMDSFEFILGSWADRKGYPLVSVNYDRESLHLTQKQFWSDPKQPREDGTWWIPLNIASKNSLKFETTKADKKLSLRGESSKTVSITDIEDFSLENWYILNMQQTGYYRVNYNLENWQQLTLQLQIDPFVIHVLNRAALIDDVFVLAKTGDVPYRTAMEMSRYLHAENDYIPWVSALSHFDELDRMIQDPETSGNLMTFIAEIIHDVYLTLGTVENSGEELLAKYARNLVINWACRVGIDDCRSRVRTMFTKMLYENTPVNVNLQAGVYCASLRTATMAEYTNFMEKLAASDDQDERGRMIDAMGCAYDENKLMAFLESTLDGSEFGYREAEKPRVVLSVLKGNRNGATAVIKFYRENYQQFLEK